MRLRVLADLRERGLLNDTLEWTDKRSRRYVSSRDRLARSETTPAA
jgi:hypothetical protein